MEQVTLRPCAEQDLDAVAELERQWEQEQNAYGDFNPLGREGLLAALERFPAYFLVAERDDQFLGYIRGSLHQAAPAVVLPPEGACLEIEDLYVQPDVRGDGVGQSLLYQRHGFTPWHIQFFMQDDGSS